jgi:hypothetical protein
MRARVVWALAVGAIALCSFLGAAVAAMGAPGANPLFILKPEPPKFPLPLVPPPVGELEGPCGLTVDDNSRLYISDYYHHAIDVYAWVVPIPPPTPPPPAHFEYGTQLANEDPLDGPCALALGPAGNLYVNNYHRNVVRFGPLTGFGSGTILAGAGADSSHPTGLAVDSVGTVYVNERSRIATFDGAGVEGEPIGEGSLEDGYGLAVSGYAATSGYLYVPDAATDTIKVYDPTTSTTDPVEEIDGSETPVGHFVSLRDSAVAVDNVRGTVYVVDDLTPAYTEGHEGVVYAFDSSGVYQGRLKYSVQLALPAGLAVDNSALTTQGRVYVTSGYTEFAEVYAYAPESAGTAAVPLPGSVAFNPSASSSSASGSAEEGSVAAEGTEGGSASVAAATPAGAVPPSPPVSADPAAPGASSAHRAEARKHRHHKYHRPIRRTKR